MLHDKLTSMNQTFTNFAEKRWFKLYKSGFSSLRTSFSIHLYAGSSTLKVNLKGRVLRIHQLVRNQSVNEAVGTENSDQQRY